MRYSQLFTRTTKNTPADEVSKNAQLLIKAGYIHKEMAGVYAYLPLGLKVFKNIQNIVREEMDALGAHEIIMTTLQPPDNWQTTDRWDEEKVDVWFKTQLKNGTDIGLAWSHEEPITAMMKQHITSYRDLPANVYQFQNKMRNETRAKSGIMRTREFVMKDLYSYSLNDQQHQEFYDRVTASYLKIFKRIGIGDITYFTFASGGAFTQFSHEFQTVCPAGEDTIYIDKEKNIAINEEVMTDEVLKMLEINRDNLVEEKASEVGNIFSFGATKSEQMGLYYTDEAGQQQPVILGSYGIGIGRLMGVMVETFADDKGLVWPEEIAPARVYLAALGDEGTKQAEALYKSLTDANIAVLFDDRDISAGQKLADADLLGLPWRVVASNKTAEATKLELKRRSQDDTQLMTADELMKKLSR